MRRWIRRGRGRGRGRERVREGMLARKRVGKKVEVVVD